MIKKLVFLLILTIALLSTISCAHSGKTDSYGGHYNHSEGTYHYHDGSYYGTYTAPIEESGTRIDYLQIHDTYEEEPAKEVIDATRILEENEKLKNSMTQKENVINKLYNEINSKQNEINNLKEEKQSLHAIYLFILFIIFIILIVKYSKKENN